MEPTASRVAILPKRNPLTGIAGGRATNPRDARAGVPGCTIHWFRRNKDTPGAGAKRVAILDPFEIERRLLVALAQAHGHRVDVHRDADGLVASFDDVPPQIAFVHIRFDQAVRRAADSGRYLPPIVLIDSCGITARGQEQLVPIGDFTALRFPIGLREFAEAIRRNAL